MDGRSRHAFRFNLLVHFVPATDEEKIQLPQCVLIEASRALSFRIDSWLVLWSDLVKGEPVQAQQQLHDPVKVSFAPRRISVQTSLLAFNHWQHNRLHSVVGSKNCGTSNLFIAGFKSMEIDTEGGLTDSKTSFH